MEEYQILKTETQLTAEREKKIIKRYIKNNAKKNLDKIESLHELINLISEVKTDPDGVEFFNGKTLFRNSDIDEKNAFESLCSLLYYARCAHFKYNGSRSMENFELSVRISVIGYLSYFGILNYNNVALSTINNFFNPSYELQYKHRDKINAIPERNLAQLGKKYVESICNDKEYNVKLRYSIENLSVVYVPFEYWVLKKDGLEKYSTKPGMEIYNIKEIIFDDEKKEIIKNKKIIKSILENEEIRAIKNLLQI